MSYEGLLASLLGIVIFLMIFVVCQNIVFSSYKEQQECIFRVIDSGLNIFA